MANITVPYTFVNDTQTADGTQVNANFQSILSGLVNGANDFSFANLAVASSVSHVGPVTFYSSVSNIGSSTFQGTVYLANGAVSAPVVCFSNSTTTGIWRKGADNLAFSAAAAQVGEISSAGAWTIGAAAGSQTHTINGNVLLSSTAATFTFLDSNGTADDRRLKFVLDAGNLSISSIKDDGSAVKTDIINIDLDIGSVGFGGVADATDQLGSFNMYVNDNSADALCQSLRNTNTGAFANGLKIKWYFSDTGGTNYRQGGLVGFEKEQVWTSTLSTQDSSFVVDVGLNGALSEAFRVSSDKVMKLFGYELRLNNQAGATATNLITTGATDGTLAICSDTTAASGAVLTLFGSTNAAPTKVTLSAISLAHSIANSGAAVFQTITNSSNTASSKSYHAVITAGTTADDAYYYVSDGTTSFAWGIDASTANDPFTLSRSTALGTNNVLTVDNNGNGITLWAMETVRISDTAAQAYFVDFINTNTGAVSNGVYFRTGAYDTGGNWRNLGIFGYEKEQTWTSTASTRDCKFCLYTSLDGAVGSAGSEALIVTSAKVLQLPNGYLTLTNTATVASAAANAVNIGAKDDSTLSTATLAIQTEYAVEAIGTFTPANKVRIWWNGVEYWIQLDPV